MQDLVARRMREAREAANVTQSELGERLGPLLGKEWSRQTVSAAEQGKRAFTAAEMLAIAYVVGGQPSSWLVLPPDVPSVTLPGGAEVSREDLRQAAATGRGADARLLELLNALVPVSAQTAAALANVNVWAERLQSEILAQEGENDGERQEAP